MTAVDLRGYRRGRSSDDLRENFFVLLNNGTLLGPRSLFLVTSIISNDLIYIVFNKGERLTYMNNIKEDLNSH